MTKIMHIQIKKIDIDKWNEGCRINKDPGKEFVISWIEKNADWFRNAWNSSQCKSCLKWRECGYLLTKDCQNFEEDYFRETETVKSEQAAECSCN